MEPEAVPVLTGDSTTVAPVRQLSPHDVREHLADSGGQLLDVREPWEYELASLPDAKRVQLAELPSRLRELNRCETVVIYCHHGIRSWHAACFLEREGFMDVVNLAGGIDAWSRTLDPGIPRY